MKTATAVLPVRYCDDPGCQGAYHCPRVTQLRIGLTEMVQPGRSREDVSSALRQEIALNSATGTDGIPRFVPLDTPFTIHVTPPGPDGVELHTAAYEGDIDVLLAGAPEWHARLFDKRLAAL